MYAKAKKNDPKPDVKRMVENVIRCKWSLSVLDMISRGINRPGAMEREVEGLTTKVLNERLRKLRRFGIIEKRTFPEVPPRVEYSFTDFGTKFVGLLEAIKQLEDELSEERASGD
jgi:DNA-binding HxlR family transcriptional regulator